MGFPPEFAPTYMYQSASGGSVSSVPPAIPVTIDGGGPLGEVVVVVDATVVVGPVVVTTVDGTVELRGAVVEVADPPVVVVAGREEEVPGNAVYSFVITVTETLWVTPPACTVTIAFPAPTARTFPADTLATLESLDVQTRPERTPLPAVVPLLITPVTKIVSLSPTKRRMDEGDTRRRTSVTAVDFLSRPRNRLGRGPDRLQGCGAFAPEGWTKRGA